MRKLLDDIYRSIGLKSSNRDKRMVKIILGESEILQADSASSFRDELVAPWDTYLRAFFYVLG